MKCKFKLSHKIVILVLVLIFIVVDVVHDSLENLVLLELVRYLKAGDPLRVQVVVDDLCVAYLAPLPALLLIQHDHAICSRERVQVGQVLAREVQLER